MKKALLRPIFFAFLTLVSMTFLSCSITFDNILGPGQNNNPPVHYPTPYASTSELDAVTNGSQDYVFWRLSRFFAVAQMQNFSLKNGWDDATLSERAVIIYDGSSRPRFYEFRIIRNGEEVGAISANAQKLGGEPVQYVLDHVKDYGDIYARGVNYKVIAEQYPSTVFYGVLSTPGNDPTYVVDPATGKQTNVIKELSALEFLTNADAEFLSNMGITNDTIKNDLVQEQLSNKTQQLAFWSQIEQNMTNLIKLTDKQIIDAMGLTKGSWVDEYILNKWASIANWFNPGGICGPNSLTFISVGNNFYPGWGGGAPGNNNMDAIREVYYFWTNACRLQIGGAEAIMPWDMRNALTDNSSLSMSGPFGHNLNLIRANLQANSFPVVSLRIWGNVNGTWKWVPHYRVIIGTKREFNDWGFSLFGIWISGISSTDWFLMHDNGTDGGNYWEAPSTSSAELAVYPVYRYKADPPAPPVVNAYPVQNNPVQNCLYIGLQTVTLNWQPAIDAVEYGCVVRFSDGTAITNTSGNLSFDFVPAKTGFYYWSVYSKDSANVIHSGGNTWLFGVQPSTPVLTYPTGIVPSSQSNITFQWSDNHDARCYLFTLDGVTTTLFNNSICLPVPLGNHTWSVIAESHDNNQQSYSNSASFIVTPVWQSVGSIAATSNSIIPTRMAFDSAGNPYILCSDNYYNNAKATVYKYDGNSWQTVGPKRFAGYNGISFPIIAIGPDNLPCIAGGDMSGNSGTCPTVMKFDGGSWQTLGDLSFLAANPMSATYAVDMKMNSTGTPYLLCADGYYRSDKYATVLKYEGGSWKDVGARKFIVTPVSMAIAPDGTIYVLSVQAAAGNPSTWSGPTVVKFDGSSWQMVGAAVFLGHDHDSASPVSIEIAPDGTPYVLCAQAYGPTVAKFNGGSWQVVGSSEFIGNSSGGYSLAVSPGGVPYVSFNEDSGYHWSGPSVMRYNGSAWEYAGARRFTGGYGINIAPVDMKFSPDGTPYMTCSVGTATAFTSPVVLKFQ